MPNTILALEPKKIWNHFYNLTQIPRPSGCEKRVIEHIRQFADQLGLENKIDSTGNLIVRKKAYKGKENIKSIVMQAHVDMVPQKNSGKVHNFQTDPIETLVDGEWVKANQTTLGADNGIGAAAIMSVLEAGDIQHGPLEALFTVSEETGMDGAFGLDKNDLRSKILLNLDSEDEGELYVGCAGGIDLNATWNYHPESPSGGIYYRISLSGLKGGHSGIDINLGRANANKVMLKMLDDLSEQTRYQLVSFTGGNLRNAIPRESEAVLYIGYDDEAKISDFIMKVQGGLLQRYKGIEDSIIIKAERVSSDESCMNISEQRKFTELLINCPDGVLAMSDTIQGVVQTSNNLAIVKAGQGSVEVKTLLRSSDDKEKMETGGKIRKMFTNAGIEAELCNGYPGWLPDDKSEVLAVARQVYSNMFGKQPLVKVIHAGLECGIIGSKYAGMDMISFGPTIRHPHSPDEKVNIESVSKFWKFLVGIIKELAL